MSLAYAYKKDKEFLRSVRKIYSAFLHRKLSFVPPWQACVLREIFRSTFLHDRHSVRSASQLEISRSIKRFFQSTFRKLPIQNVAKCVRPYDCYTHISFGQKTGRTFAISSHRKSNGLTLSWTSQYVSRSLASNASSFLWQELQLRFTCRTKDFAVCTDLKWELFRIVVWYYMNKFKNSKNLIKREGKVVQLILRDPFYLFLRCHFSHTLTNFYRCPRTVQAALYFGRECTACKYNNFDTQEYCMTCSSNAAGNQTNLEQAI